MDRKHTLKWLCSQAKNSQLLPLSKKPSVFLEFSKPTKAIVVCASG